MGQLCEKCCPKWRLFSTKNDLPQTTNRQQQLLNKNSNSRASTDPPNDNQQNPITPNTNPTEQLSHLQQYKSIKQAVRQNKANIPSLQLPPLNVQVVAIDFKNEGLYNIDESSYEQSYDSCEYSRRQTLQNKGDSPLTNNENILKHIAD